MAKDCSTKAGTMCYLQRLLQDWPTARRTALSLLNAQTMWREVLKTRKGFYQFIFKANEGI
jgi:hypothetical protein